jgi:transposase
MMRVNLFRPVHVKTLKSQKHRALLTARKLLQEKAIAIENDVRGLLRNFGLKVGVVGTAGFEARILELIEDMPDLMEIIRASACRQRKAARGVLPPASASAVSGPRGQSVPMLDDDTWCWPRHIACLHQHD